MTIKSHAAFLVFGAAVGFAAGFKAGEAVYADEKEKETMKEEEEGVKGEKEIVKQAQPTGGTGARLLPPAAAPSTLFQLSGRTVLSKFSKQIIRVNPRHIFVFLAAAMFAAICAALVAQTQPNELSLQLSSSRASSNSVIPSEAFINGSMSEKVRATFRR